MPRSSVPFVKYNKEILEHIANLSIEVAVDGHRADIFMLKTAQTIAAFHQRNYITNDDVKESCRTVHTPFKKKAFSGTKDEE